MFIFSFKSSNKKKIILLAIIILALAIFFISFKSCSSITVLDDGPNQGGISNNEQRIFYLKSLGLVVSAQPFEMVDVTIPDEFDDVYNRYNELQKQAGFDLSHYKGEACIRYTYNVYNFENSESPVYVNILVIEDHVIGGDICSAELDGFMLPLNYMLNSEEQ